MVIAPGDLHRCGAHAARCAELRFEQLIDLCGVDYSSYGNATARSVPLRGRVSSAVAHAQLAAAPAHVRAKTTICRSSIR